jgi:hypothetical protein
MGVIEKRRVRRQAGGRAERHYRELRKQWRRDHRKVFLIFGLMTLAMFIAMLTLAALMPRYTFLAGVGAGAFFGALVVFRDTPPSWIERYREGAQGEQLTAREIVKLLPRGWVVLSDLHRDKANIDHVLIGPAGVFVLDSKNLNGTVETSGDQLRLTRAGQDRPDYTTDQWASKVRGQAWHVNELLRERRRTRIWVSGVVVLWAKYPQQHAVGNKMQYVHGPHLIAWLREQPPKLSELQVKDLSQTLSPGRRRRRAGRCGSAQEPHPTKQIANTYVAGRG